MSTTIPDLGAAIERLERRLGVDTLWLFGSRARGGETPTSDVDLAGLFRSSPGPLDLFELRAELQDLLGMPVDLIDLDRASPVLAMQVLRHGSRLVDANPVRRHRFEAATPGRYDDLMRVRRPIEQKILERMTHGGT
jgi:predicted nucleotidyltransferase